MRLNKTGRRGPLSHPIGSAGRRLRAALRADRPLQIVGVINAYAGILAERAGFRALYLSGAGVANQLTRAEFDPHSRQPSYKHCAVRIEAIG